MATKLYADRAFIIANGFELANMKTANLKCSDGLQRVDTMSRNRRSAGFKRGNRSIQIAIVLEIEADKAAIDPMLASPDADLTMVFECGGDRYLATGLAQSDFSIDGSVGDASKSMNLEALDLVNENGQAVNIDIALA